MNIENKTFVVNYSNHGQSYTQKFTFDQVKNEVEKNTPYKCKKLTKKEILSIFFELWNE